MLDRYVVVGHPIAHSMSPFIHADFAAQLGLALQYEKLFSPLNGFAQTVTALQAAGVKGANVTVPFKLEAFALANAFSQAAQFAQAANTLIFLPNGQIKADNTDGQGLCMDLNRQLQKLDLNLAQCQIVMIGAGGAAQGCLPAFHAEGVRHVMLLNRTVSKAHALAIQAKSLGLAVAGAGLDSLPIHVEDHTVPVVVVNASSSSLKGDVPRLHPAWYDRAVLVYDMMYSATPTPFMESVKTLNKVDLACSDGLGMLVFQAQLAFETWTGQKPNGLQTLHRVRQVLSAQVV